MTSVYVELVVDAVGIAGGVGCATAGGEDNVIAVGKYICSQTLVVGYQRQSGLYPRLSIVTPLYILYNIPNSYV